MADIIPKAALDYIKNKNLTPAFSYKDVWNEEHAAAFTVAKAMQIDVLADLHNAVTQAIGSGQSFDTFKKNIKPTLQQKGWWGRKEIEDPLTGHMVNAQLGSDRRLKTIYNVNMRSAYQKGQYDRTMASDLHPYLMYRLGTSVKHRKEHESWDGLILPKDDPFWDAHFPPNGWGCKCYTRAVTQSQKDKYAIEGIPVPPRADGSGGGRLRIKTEAPRITYKTFINEHKGIIEHIPVGVDPAFNWNVGKGRILEALREKTDATLKTVFGAPVEERIQNIAGIKKVSLPNTPDNVKEGVLEGYKSVLSKYPELHGKFNSLDELETTKGVYASCIAVNGVISLNKEFFAEMKTIVKAYKEDVILGYHPKGTDWKATIAHEIGHRINTLLDQRFAGELIKYGDSYDMALHIQEEALYNLNLTLGNVGKELSGYATKNPREFFAEAFAEYINSRNPRKLAKEVGRMVDLAMRGVFP